MEIVLKVIGYFFLWTLYSYICHVIAHVRFKYNFLQYFHMKHHAYNYDDKFWPAWHDYFFFGSVIFVHLWMYILPSLCH